MSADNLAPQLTPDVDVENDIVQVPEELKANVTPLEPVVNTGESAVPRPGEYTPPEQTIENEWGTWVEIDDVEEVEPFQPTARQEVQLERIDRTAEDVERSARATGRLEDAASVIGVERALFATHGEDPAKTAETIKLMKATELPHDVVSGNETKVASVADHKRIMGILTQRHGDGTFKYPKIIKHLNDPKWASVSRGDVESYARLERDTIQYGEEADPLSKMAVAIESAVASGGNAISGGAEFYFRRKAEQARKREQAWRGGEPIAADAASKEGAFFTEDYFTVLAELAGKLKQEEVLPLERTEGTLGNFFYDVVGFLPQAGAITAAGIATGGTSTAAKAAAYVVPSSLLGSFIYGSKVKELQDKGIEDQDVIHQAAATSAILEGAIELLQFGQLMRATRLRGGSKLSLLTNYLKMSGQQGFEETIQNISSEATSVWAETQGQDLEDRLGVFFERLPEATKQGVYEGLIIQPMVGGFAAAGAVKLYAEANQRQVDADFYTNMDETIAKTQTQKIAKSGSEALVKKLVGDSDAKSLYLQADVMRQDAQEHDGLEQMEEDIKEMGLEEEFQNSLDTGDDMEVPRDKWHAQMAGTDASVRLTNKMRFRDKGVTVEGLVQQQKELVRQTAQFREDLENDAVHPVIKEFRDQVMATHSELPKAAEVADSIAGLLNGFAVTQASDQGVTLDEWLGANQVVLQRAAGVTTMAVQGAENRVTGNREFQIDNDTKAEIPIKFRATLKPLQHPVFKNAAGKKLPKAEVIKASSNKKNKDVEKALMQEVLDEQFADTDEVDVDQYVSAVEDKLVQLVPTITASLNTYGLKEAGLEGADGTKDTVLYNAPIDHGILNINHFPSDYGETGVEVEYEVVPLKDGTWGVVSPTERTLGYSDGIIGVVGTQQEAQEWINHKEWINSLQNNVGLFGHVREWNVGGTRLLAEIQSDTFQQQPLYDIITETIKRRVARGGGSDADVAYVSKVLRLEQQIAAAVADVDALMESSEENFFQEQFDADAGGALIEDDVDNAKFGEIEQVIETKQKSINVKQQRVRSLEKKRDKAEKAGDTEEAQRLSEAVDTLNDRIASEEADVLAADEELLFLQVEDIRDDVKAKSKELREFKQQGTEELYTEEDKAFAAHYNNYLDRLLRESLAKAAQDGVKAVALPTPYTMAVIQGYVKRDKVTSEEEFNKAVDTMSNTHYGIVKKYEKLFKKFNTLRPDAKPTEFGGLPWQEATITKADSDQKIIAFQKGKGVVRGMTEVIDGTSVITMFNEANLSTLLHELAHFFMNAMTYSTESGLASVELANSFASAMEQFDNDPEVFARTFEGYTFEGKSPRADLIPAFKAFRDWLTPIYKNLQGISEASGVELKLNDETRGFFDSILATEDEIKDVKSFYEGVFSGAEALVNVLNPDTKVIADIEEKEKEAKEATFAKQLSKLLKSRLKGGQRKQIRDEMRVQVKNDPVYVAAYQAIDAGGFLESELLAVEGIGADDITALRSVHSKLVKKRGKSASLTELSIANGFGSVAEMVQAIAEKPPREQEILNKTEERILEIENSIKLSLEEGDLGVAGEAYHNEENLDLMIAKANMLADEEAKREAAEVRLNEQEAFAASPEGVALSQQRLAEANRKARERKLEKAQYTTAAKEIIENRTVGEATRYDRFARAQAKYARIAKELAEVGDIAGSYDAMQKQILNHALVMEAIRVRDERKTIERRMGTKRLNDSLKNVKREYADGIRDLVNFYKINPKIQPRNEGAFQDLPIFKGDNANDLINTLFDLTSFIPDWMQLRRYGEKDLPTIESYRDLTVKDFRAIDNVIKMLNRRGKNIVTALDTKFGDTIQEQADNASAVMSQGVQTKPDADDTTLTNWKRKALASISMMEFVMAAADNNPLLKGEGFGVNEASVFNTMSEADNNSRKMLAEISSRIAPFEKRLAEAVNRIDDSGALRNLPVSPKMQEVGSRWTGEKALAAMFNMGTKANKFSLTEGHLFTEAQLGQLGSLFSNTEWDAIQDVWDALDSLFAPMKKVVGDLTGKDVAKEEAEPFTVVTADGTIKSMSGGYYPLIYDTIISRVAAKQEIESLDQDYRNAVYHSQAPGAGMAVERVTDVEGNPVVKRAALLSYGVLTRHIEKTVRVITHSKAVHEVDELTRNSTWSAAFEAKFGRHMYGAMRKWLADQANPNRSVDNVLLQMLHKARPLATAGILGYNVAVGFKQRLSLIPAYVEMRLNGKNSMKYLVKAFTSVGAKNNIWGSTNTEQVALINERSLLMRDRGTFVDQNIRENLKRIRSLQLQNKIEDRIANLLETTAPSALPSFLSLASGVRPAARKAASILDAVEEASFYMIKANDAATVYPVWLAAYSQALNERIGGVENGMKQEQAEKAAIKYADSVVTKTQPSSRIVDLSEAQRDEVWKLSTSFMTFMLKEGNRVLNFVQATREGTLTKPQAAGVLMGEIVLPVWTLLAIKALLASDDEDKPEVYEWFTEPVLFGVSLFPVVREAVSIAKYRSRGSVPVLSSVADRGYNLSKAAKDAAVEGDFRGFVWELFRTAEFLRKTPVSNLLTDTKKNYELLTGKEWDE